VTTTPIKVLIVDDSALMRRLLTEVMERDSRLVVVGSAADPYIAREKIKRLAPDVLTLDVEMPRMDGITFLRNLMRLRPMPVVMVSTLTEAGGEVTLEALELGAVDFVSKPKIDVRAGIEDYAEEICDKVVMASKVQVKSVSDAPRKTAATVSRPIEPKLDTDAVLKRKQRSRASLQTTEKLIAIGASTGGTEAIKEVLIKLPPDSPAVVITQHIPAAFSQPFANRLDSCCAIKVCQASDGQQVLPGHGYVAPGDKHMLIERSGARYYCRLNDGPPVNRHKPSVDVMFRSVAQEVGANAVGVLLTGMGADGADGLLEMREAGSPTVAQDQATSVVWGMPGEAVKRGAAEQVLPLQEVPGAILALLEHGKAP
jgi:two-component system chemotaxis response regulator CheB